MIVVFATKTHAENYAIRNGYRLGDGNILWAGEPRALVDVHEHVEVYDLGGHHSLHLMKQFEYAKILISKINKFYPRSR